jgi:hypothetical protein
MGEVGMCDEAQGRYQLAALRDFAARPHRHEPAAEEDDEEADAVRPGSEGDPYAQSIDSYHLKKDCQGGPDPVWYADG